MVEKLEVQIRKLQEHYWSEADPQGRGFVPLADLYRRIGDLSEARRLLKDGLSRHGNMASGHVVLGRVFLDLGNPAEAEAAFRAALAVDPDNIGALKGLGDLLVNRGKTREALEIHRALHFLDPLDAEVRDRLGPLESQAEVLGRIQEAHALEGALPGSGDGTPWEDGEGAAESLDWETASLQTDRSHQAEAGTEGREGLEGTDAEDGREPEFEAAAQEVSEASKADALATRTMGELYLRQGLLREARSVFQDLLEKEPGDQSLRDKLVEVEELIQGGPEQGFGGGPSAGLPKPPDQDPQAGLAPDSAVPVTDLAPDFILPMDRLAPDTVIPVGDLAPDLILPIESLAPDTIVSIHDLAPEVILPIEALAPDSPQADSTLDDFEAWLDRLP